MSSYPYRYRQIHLDFHTSPACLAVGEDFDAKEFAATLKSAHVDAINVFARCHHGYSYYPTQVGTVHPGLKFDLLGHQLEALHEVGIRAPIYLTVLWDELAGAMHPEWVIANKDGRLASRSPLSNEWGWTTLDVSTSYFDYLAAQVKEISQNYPVDGFWFDICFARPNYSRWGMAQMAAAGVNAADDDAVWAFARQKQETFMARMSAYVQSLTTDATIFYNGTVERSMRRTMPYMTHSEVESLPTSGTWGYLHFPIMARQARMFGKPIIGMTGRFHTFWGDFGGLKTEDQLLYECAVTVAAGAQVCVGDQLHPAGRLDPAVYRLIGSVYEKVAQLEPWLIDATPCAEAAILSLGKLEEELDGIGTQSPDTEGAVQMLIELGIQCDVVDAVADLARYRLVILPDTAELDIALTAKLDEFVAQGGALIFSGTAGLTGDGSTFALHDSPVRYAGVAPTQPSFLRPSSMELGASGLSDDYDYAFYDPTHQVVAGEGAVTYGHIQNAYFRRSWHTFMGHQHAPVRTDEDGKVGPLAVRKGRVLYLAAPLFAGYRRRDYWAYRALVDRLLEEILPDRLLRTDAPGWMECTINRQPAAAQRPPRDVIHVIAFQPRRTLQPVLHVDQGWRVEGPALHLRSEQAPERVYLAPSGQALEFSWAAGTTSVMAPAFKTYQVIVVEYA